MREAIPIRRAALTLFGPLVWAAHFLVVYASESLFCRSAGGSAHSVLVIAASVIAIVVILRDFRAQRRLAPADGVERYLAQARRALNGLSILATIAVAAVGLALPACR